MENDIANEEEITCIETWEQRFPIVKVKKWVPFSSGFTVSEKSFISTVDENDCLIQNSKDYSVFSEGSMSLKKKYIPIKYAKIHVEPFNVKQNTITSFRKYVVYFDVSNLTEGGKKLLKDRVFKNWKIYVYGLLSKYLVKMAGDISFVMTVRIRNMDYWWGRNGTVLSVGVKGDLLSLAARYYMLLPYVYDDSLARAIFPQLEKMNIVATMAHLYWNIEKEYMKDPSLLETDILGEHDSPDRVAAQIGDPHLALLGNFC